MPGRSKDYKGLHFDRNHRDSLKEGIDPNDPKVINKLQSISDRLGVIVSKLKNEPRFK